MILCFKCLAVAASAAFLSVTLSATALQPVATIDPQLGPPPTGGGDSWHPILTPDGRYVLFASTANNLASASNGVYQPLVPPKVNVFRRDRATGTTILVSVNLAGTGGGNGDSIPTALSTNGQYALFESAASDLVPNDTNGATDVFLRDVVSNQTFLVSVNTNGQSFNGASGSSTMTPEGRYVVFSSQPSGLIAEDANGVANVFVRDMLGGVTTVPSTGATGTSGAALFGVPMITPDGRYVAFLSGGQDFLGIDVCDLVAQSAVDAAAPARALPAVGTGALFYNVALSDDGQYVAYESSAISGAAFRYNIASGHLDLVATNLANIEGATQYRGIDMTPDGRFVLYSAAGSLQFPQSLSICLWDGATSTTTVISGEPGVTVESNSVCALPVISSNGQYVAYLSSSTALVPAVSNTVTAYHLYLWNALTGSNSLIDLEPGGQVSSDTFMSRPCITPDGRFIAFDATDSNLGGDPRPAYYNVYLSDQAANGLEVISSRQSNLPSATARALSIGSGFSISSNGQYVAYSCVANRLSADGSGTNTLTYVYVSDLASGANLIVSVDTNNIADPNGVSSNPVLSADGRYVVFSSMASNLVTNALASQENVYVRDLQTGTTTLVSTNGSTSLYPFFAPLADASGRHVLYPSTSPSGGQENLFFRDLQSGNTFQLPVGSSSLVPAFTAAAMTSDGHFVAFAGLAQTSPSHYQVCLWDSHLNGLVYAKAVSSAILLPTAASVTSIAVSADGNRLAYINTNELWVVDRAAQSNWVVATDVPSYRAGPQFSGDGRYLAYATSGGLAVNDTNGGNAVYRYDFQANTSQLISSAGQTGSVGVGSADWPAISWDGRFVAYRGVAAVPGAFPQIYLYDSQSNSTTLLSSSVLAGGGGNNRSLAPTFSGDSTTVFFRTWASDLLTNDFSGSGGLDALTVAVYPPALVGAIQFSSGGLPVISWPAVSGRNYQAQYKNNLADPSWQTLPGTVTVVSNTGWVTDPQPASPQRFYRVQSN